MSGDRRTTRRRFLVIGGLSAVAAGGAGVVRWISSGPSLPLTSHVGTVLGAEPLRAIGRAYLDANPREDDESTLVRSLEARPEWRGVSDPAGALRALRRGSRADFGRGRVVRVEGWYLAESEARACALATFA